MYDKEIGVVKKTLCGDTAPLANLAENIVGTASVCWCCSFWRGVLFGGALASTVSAVLCFVTK